MNEERLFNHRLYHLVYHWAAWTATLVLLLSLGSLVAVTPPAAIRHAGYLRFANVAAGAASLFFLYRMKWSGDEVNRLLGSDPGAQWILTHPRNLYLAAVASLALTALNFALI